MVLKALRFHPIWRDRPPIPLRECTSVQAMDLWVETLVRVRWAGPDLVVASRILARKIVIAKILDA